jgi:hypothetical protein
VLAAYCLRQGLLVWLKAYKADIELRGLDPRTGLRSHSINHQNGQHSHVERAAAAAVADAAQSQPPVQSPSPFAQMDVNAPASHRTHEAEPLANGNSQSSRSLQGPNFSSNAFPSFGSTAPLLQSPGASFSYNDQPLSPSMTHSNSNMGSPRGAAGTPRPRRAAPPPPVAAAPSPFALVSPFAQSAAPAFPPLERSNSSASSISEKGSSEQQRRPTVRFAADAAPRDSRGYNHTNSGFTELAMARSQEDTGHSRSRSDNGGRNPAATVSRPGHHRSLSRNRSLSRQERAASANLDVLGLPPLPLPTEAIGGAEEALTPATSPGVSRQPSRHLSIMRQMSGFRCVVAAACTLHLTAAPCHVCWGCHVRCVAH